MSLSDITAAFRSCLTCFSAPSLVFHGRKLSVVRLLGEGGFAYVYLVEDQETQKQYALKKIRCPFGAESVAKAMTEANACKLFRGSSRVTSLVDSMVKQDEDGTKTVYLLLPFYSGGSLQDLINDNAITGQHFTESQVIQYALGIAKALEVMHHFRPTGSEARRENSGEQDRLLDDADVELSEAVPHAHRDIKPGNVMLDGNTLVLMDLGSCTPARVNVESSRQALELQDLAAESCTLPYRAPELLNVASGSRIDERVDIWSLGCTIYALMYSISPFERAERQTGASLNLAIANRKFDFPSDPPYSEDLRNFVDWLLTSNVSDRPFIDAVVSKLDQLSSS